METSYALQDRQVTLLHFQVAWSFPVLLFLFLNELLFPQHNLFVKRNVTSIGSVIVYGR